MTALDEFLDATDLDGLLSARDKLPPLTVDETARIESIIEIWGEQQSLANLLFHPGVIPTRLRWETIDRGLRSSDVPYLTLAAVVGLQAVKPEDVPTVNRDKWREILLCILQSESGLLAGRASVTMFSWFSESEAPAVLPLYPVADETSSKNILAFALSLFGDLSGDEFTQRLLDCGVSARTIAPFNGYRSEYVSKTSDGAPGAGFMKCPLLCYIPNMSEVSVSPPTNRGGSSGESV